MKALCNCQVNANGGPSVGRNTAEWSTAKDHIDWLTGAAFTSDPAQAIVDKFWPTGPQPSKLDFLGVSVLYEIAKETGLWIEPTTATGGTNNSIFQAMSDMSITASTQEDPNSAQYY